MIKQTLISAALVVSLGACTSNPAMVSANPESFDYAVDAPFNVVYDRLQIGARRCFEAHSGAPVVVANGMIDDGVARVNANVGGSYTASVLEISDAGDNTTRVRGTWVSSVGSVWYRYTVASKLWANGNYTICKAKPEAI